MEYTIIGVTFGLCLFILPLWAYRRGLKDGLAIQQGKAPEPIKTPVAMYKQHTEVKEAKREQSKLSQGIHNLMSYDGSPQEEGES